MTFIPVCLNFAFPFVTLCLQMQQASLKAAPNVPASVPKNNSPNKAADNQVMRKEGRNPSSDKADVQVHHMSPLSQTQKSPIAHIRMPSVQTPYQQHPQVPHPVHFGAPPNMHMQPPNVAPTSFQMPMPMGLPMGNTPQIQQQVFFQGLPSHPMHHQGMMHQAQGHGFAGPMGAQIHPQMGHVGVGMSPQYPQQQGGKYGGGRKTTPVKITHPDTHEELRLGGRGDPHQDGQPQGPKSHPNTPPRSHPVSAFAPRPLNVIQTSFSSSPMMYPPVSVPFNSGPMSSAQAPRFQFSVSDGSQRVQFTNQSAPHVSSDSSSVKAHVTSSALPAPGRVTVKQAATSEETNVALSQKKAETGSLDSLQQPKPGSVSALSNSSAPPAKAPVETVTVATNSVEDQTQTCKVEPSHNATEVWYCVLVLEILH